MFICEVVLMSIIVVFGSYMAYTDIKKGIIKNKTLIEAALVGIPVNLVYFIFFTTEFLWIYLSNIVFMTIISFLMYACHFWAAGDSKLLICINLLFPARFYDNDSFILAPGINGIMYIFLLAYICIIFESIYLTLKKEKFYTKKIKVGIAIKRFLQQYFTSFMYLHLINTLFSMSFGNLYYNNQILFGFVGVFIAILMQTIELFKKWYCLIMVTLINVFFLKNITMESFQVSSYVVLLIALLLRYLLSGYNYKEIPTINVKEGMVLSYVTVLRFLPSRIKGLPTVTYEDMRSRLNTEEVSAIMRWKDSKYGEDTITIVRKIPFAIFIVLGELIYFIIRMQ